MTCCVAGSTLIDTGRIGVGVLVGPNVGVDVGVFVGVSVGHGPLHGVGVGVSVGVPVCVGVGVVVGVSVGVGHGPLHGPMTREPEMVCAAKVAPLTSVTITSLSVSGVTPSPIAVKATDARMPLPLGPAGALPSVTHVSCAVPVAIVAGRQNSVRPVLPMNGPAVIDVALSNAGSKLSVSWKAPTFAPCWMAIPALNDVPLASVSASGSTHTARPSTPQSMTGVGVNVGVTVGVLVGVSVGQMPPGHGVGVNVGVAVGPLSMTAEPSYATAKIALPSGSASDGSRCSCVVPRAAGAHVIVAIVPAPDGPLTAPVVTQPKCSCFIVPTTVVSTGAGQNTVRPVLPRNASFVADANDTIDESYVISTS